MDDESRHRIIELGMTAPSVDNTQPFHFRWDGDRLEIFRDGARDRKRGGAGHYVSMVGLGTLVECLTIAAGGEGYVTDTTVTFDPGRLEGPWASLSFRSSDVEADELLDGLPLRSSDRRLYRGGSLDDDVFARIAADNDGLAGGLYFQDRPDERLLDYLLTCEVFMWNDEYILPEMLSWVRWSRSAVERTRDGVPWQALAVGILPSRVMMLVAKSTRFRRLARRTGGPLSAQQKSLEAHVRSSAALGCFTVPDTRPVSMLRVGRAFLRTWVRLNMAGYGVQVMANPSLHVLQHTAGVIPEDYPEVSKRVFAGGRDVLTQAFGCSENEIPAWMFRTGKSDPVLPAMRTLRRSVRDVTGQT